VGRVLVSCIHLQRGIEPFRERFESAGFKTELPEVDQQLPESWLIENAGRFDGVIAGDDPFTDAVLSRGAEGRLRALVKWGVGVDAIDLHACERLGVKFAHTPAMFGDEVADVAMGYVVMLLRHLHEIDRSVRAGGWLKPPGRSLGGMTLGVVGLGSIGAAVVERAKAFGMRVIGSDEFTKYQGDSAVQTSFDEVLENADVLVLACSLTPSSLGLVNASTLARMKPGSYIVNVARGALVVEADLVVALESGRIAGAGLDVFEHEPLLQDSPLRRFNQCVFGSHNSSNTIEGVDRVNRLTVDLLLDLLKQ
jgi:D-3-phosphoglycerate dehydrogenase